MIFCFDVFDTVITRKVATPWGIFALIRDKLRKEQSKNGIAEYVIENFYELRIHSERLIRESYSARRIEEITLQGIYEAMAVSGLLSEAQIAYLCELEEKMEWENVIGIQENIHRIETLLAQGERVILVSDMYLSQKAIRSMLTKVSGVLASLPLYVSSEYRKRKTSGELYRHVQSLEKIPFENWIHIGDNKTQDLRIPFELGMRVEYWPVMEKTAFEKKLLENLGDDTGLQRIISAAVRSETFHEKEAMEQGLRGAYHIGCRYAGPVLYSYAAWIVEQAREKKIRRLYFIARDGYLIKKIVDFILLKSHTDIRTSYIYGSRKAWRMPSLSGSHYNLYQLVLWSHFLRIHSLEDLAAVLHLSLHELYPYLPGTYAKNKENTRISIQELEYIVDILSGDKTFQQFHLQKLSKERLLTQMYLEQEVNVADDDFAFVDVSGGGLTQGCLRELLKDRYPKPIRTFFFKIDRVNLVEQSILYTFLPSFLENNLTIEMMCRAPHGQTRGYEEKNGSLVPVFDAVESEELIEHGFFAYERGILDFTECMYENTTETTCGSLKIILFYLQQIAQNPPEDVLEFFASMPSGESGRGESVVEYAPKLTEQDIKNIFLYRTYEPLEEFYKGTDLNYSVLRADRETKALIERCKKERDSVWGRMFRQKKDHMIQARLEKYGKAAFYPIRLLEEKIILYGAGKMGRHLYQRLFEDPEHSVVLWVDKQASAYRSQGIELVSDLLDLQKFDSEPIVIAVAAEKTALQIRRELEEMGVDKKRILWFYPWNHPYGKGIWKVEGIG